jgi:hypothetical protein
VPRAVVLDRCIPAEGEPVDLITLRAEERLQKLLASDASMFTGKRVLRLKRHCVEGLHDADVLESARGESPNVEAVERIVAAGAAAAVRAGAVLLQARASAGLAAAAASTTEVRWTSFAVPHLGLSSSITRFPAA